MASIRMPHSGHVQLSFRLEHNGIVRGFQGRGRVPGWPGRVAWVRAYCRGPIGVDRATFVAVAGYIEQGSLPVRDVDDAQGARKGRLVIGVRTLPISDPDQVRQGRTLRATND